jgi:hypothetical protein
MQPSVEPSAPPEYNLTGLDFAQRDHLGYQGPLVDVHAHIMRTNPDPEEEAGPSPEPGLAQAGVMLAVAEEFGIVRTYSMCPPDDILPLRERYGPRLGFNGPIAKAWIDEPDEAVYHRLDRFLELGVEIIKFFAAPRGRERGLLVDAPWRIEAAKRAREAGVRVFMVHVADPDVWFGRDYADTATFGTKSDQYLGLCHLLELFPDLTVVAAHMGGDPEHPDHLEALLDRYPNLYFDTSATKWQVREVSAHRAAIRSLISRHPDRFLFGSDLVTRHGLARDHYVSRYWCQRTLWESTWEGRSPIEDIDYRAAAGEPATPPLRGLDLPANVLKQVYHLNAQRLLPNACCNRNS